VTGAEVAGFAGAAVLLLVLVLLVGQRLSRGAGWRPARPTLAELEAQASRALVETDDAVKTSEQELGFAVARFGEHAAAPFSATLRTARSELAAAFTLRQLLDDDIPETEPTKRSMLAQIARRCTVANCLLDEQSGAFDQLQGLRARVPEVLAEVDHHVTQQASRAADSRQWLGRMAAKYTADAVAVVASSPGQAGTRLDFARTCLAGARQALDADQTGRAAMLVQAAESAADQAESLLDGIGHLEAELTQAASALPAALREIDVEIADATELPAGQHEDRSAAVDRAQVVAARVRGQLAAAAPFDALEALTRLEQADVTLDHVLATARQELDRQSRARAVLDQAMLVARSSITAADDFITTRRGGVGASARTRLAEARRHFQEAIAGAQDHPEAAVDEAQEADALAKEARSLAEQDITEFIRGQGTLGVGYGVGGAILGGILIGSAAGKRASDGSGFGPGELGPDPGELGPPGSFGGSGTRGRNSLGSADSGAASGPAYLRQPLR
jgi:hypothetical protein